MTEEQKRKYYKGCEKGVCFECGFFHEVYCELKNLAKFYWEDIVGFFDFDVDRLKDMPKPLGCLGTGAKELQQKCRANRLQREAEWAVGDVEEAIKKAEEVIRDAENKIKIANEAIKIANEAEDELKSKKSCPKKIKKQENENEQ